MSYEKYKDSIKKTNVARRAAVKILINNHRAEFDELYVQQAKEHGLNPVKIAGQIKKAAEGKDELEVVKND